MIYVGNKARAPRSRISLTAERLRELFDYDATTGIFTRRVRTAQRVHVGESAGTKGKRGQLRFSVDGRLYLAHRLAWLHVTGVWPTNQIDHKDGNPSNNAFGNLRDVGPILNTQNIRHARAGSEIPLLGVARSGSKFRADIQTARIPKYLGTFDTAEAAYAAYLAAKRQMHEGNML